MTMKQLPVQIIKKKRNHIELSDTEISDFINSYVAGDIPDYQMSSLLMAIYLNGMSTNEIATLTKVMQESGETFNFSHLHPHVVDKHSTGGVGDKTSLILAPIVASCGVSIPMIAGRGLGHTGGTLDKLESIPGFNTRLSEDDFVSIVQEHGFAIMGQTQNICPADKKIYSLRDVTGTVESLPLICGSIMSKKLSEGISSLVLDVKFGDGAFMKTTDQARALAELLKSTGEKNKVNVTALLTNMSQPLGKYVGNALEVKECYEILSGNKDPLYQDTFDLSIALSSHMILLGKKADNFDQARQLATESIESGKALACFESVSKAQGAQCKMNEIPLPSNFIELKASQSGYIQQFKNEQIGYLGIKLKAGRKLHTDNINHLTGFEFNVKIGDQVEAGDVLAKIYYDGEGNAAKVLEELKSCIEIADKKTGPVQLIVETLT